MSDHARARHREASLAPARRRRSRHRPGRFRAPTRTRGAGLLAIVIVAVMGVGVGAFAAFVSSSTSTVSIGAGEVQVEWAGSGSAALSVPVNAIRPGQSVQRLVELRNTGSLTIADLQLIVTAANTNNSDGLQLAISDCSVPWSGTGTFTCGGVESVVSADRPLRAVIGLSSLGTKQVGGRDYLRLTFRLPTTAPASLQTSSTTVSFEVLGNQGAGRHL